MPKTRMDNGTSDVLIMILIGVGFTFVVTVGFLAYALIVLR